MKYVPIIPCYNPSSIVLKIIDELINYKFKKIIVIDDGSSDKKIFKKIEKISECIVIKHDINMGKGKALKDGFKYYIDNFSNNYLGVVSFDCDGQHLVKDLIAVGNKITSSNNLVLGVRNFDEKGVPLKNKIGNKITSRVFKHFFGVYLKDTQTGLRGIPNRLLKIALNSQGDRFEYEMNMLIDAAKKQAKFEQVPIETIYMDKKKRTSHFNTLKDSYEIYKTMFKRIKK